MNCCHSDFFSVFFMCFKIAQLGLGLHYKISPHLVYLFFFLLLHILINVFWKCVFFIKYFIILWIFPAADK